MRAKRAVTRKPRSKGASPRTTSRARKSLRTTAARQTPSQGRSRKGGSIGAAAARVAESGARLVTHAGQRVVSAAADTAKAALASAAHSTAELTLSMLHSVPGRKTKH
jgi:hypothetical protein